MSVFIQNFPVENISQAYSIANKLVILVIREKKNVLYKLFVACSCNGCSIAALRDYANNLIYQELPTESEYFTNADKKVYISLIDSIGSTDELEKLRREDNKLILKINLKNALTKIMRVRLCGYSQGQYLYLITDCGLTIKYKMYSLANRKDFAS